MLRGLFLVAGLMAGATQAFGMTLAEAERLAVDNDPDRAGLLARARSAEHGAVADAALPDPELRFGALNVPLPDLAPGREPMSQVQVSLRQRLTPAAQRDARRAVGRAKAAVYRTRAALREREIRRQVRREWLALRRRGRMVELHFEHRSVLDRLIDSLVDRVGAGRENPSVLLATQARRARLERDISETRAAIGRHRARLGEWLAPHPVPERLEAADWTPPGAGTLDEHPELAEARAMTRVADRRIQLARADFRPDWSVELGLGRRIGNAPAGAVGDTLINASLSVELPLFTRNRQSRGLEAAREAAAAAEITPVGVHRRLQADLEAVRTTWREMAELARHYSETVVPLTAEVEQAADAEYAAGRTELTDLLETRVAHLEARLELETVRLDRDRAATDLMYLQDN